MAQLDRKDTISKVLQGGVKYEIDINDINTALANAREKQLSPYEEQVLMEVGQVPKRGWLQQFGRNLKADTKEMLGGLGTIGTIATQYGLQGLRKLRDSLATGGNPQGSYPMWDWINSSGRRVGTDFARGLVNDPFNTLADAGTTLLNPILGNYNTSIQDIGSNWNNPTEVQERIVPNVLRGAYDHPLSTLLDLAPVTKVVPKGAVAKGVHSLPIPQGIKNLFPTNEMETVNSIIRYNNNLAGVNFGDATTRLSDLKLARAGGNLDPTQIVKNLRTGDWQGNPDTLKATQKFADLSNEYSKAVQGLGVPAQEVEDVIKANYLLEQLDPTRSKGLQTGELQNLINRFNSGADLDPQYLSRYGIDQQGLADILGKAQSLRNEGKLAHVSQVFANNPAGVEGLEVLGETSPRLQSWLSRQNVGTATNEALGDVLFDTYDFIGRRLENATSAGNTVRDIANELGRKVKPGYKPAEGEVVISPDFIKEKLGRGFNDPSRALTGSLSSLKSGVPNNQLGNYADDLYAVDSNLLQGVINSQTRVGKNWLNDLNSSFKQTMLTTPKYLMDNRWGNTILNLANGVTPWDYARAYADIRAKKLAPRLLQNETSYAGFLGKDFVGNSFLEGEKRALAGMVDRDADLASRFKNFNLLFANPVISTESALERTDRLANMVRQSKRLAGRDWENYLKEADTDAKKYRDLITRVDNELGDYAGRNYFMSPKTRNALDLLYNFYKYPAQSARATWNLAANRPLSYQTLVNIPQEIGNAVNQVQQVVYGEQLGDDFKGGLVGENATRSWEPLVVDRYSASPLTAPLEVADAVMGGNPGDVINISPVLGDIDRIVNYKNAYGDVPSSPKYKTSKGRMVARDEAGNITLDQYKPTAGDYLRHAGALLGNQFVVPVRQANAAFFPIGAYVTGQPYYQPYDTSLLGQVGEEGRIPWFFEGKVERKGKTSFEDLLENLAGLQRYKVYPNKQTISPSEAKTLIKYDLFNRRNK